MKENKYDNDKFSEQYSRMSCSTEGLKGAGEWHTERTAASDDADPVKKKKITLPVITMD